MGSSNASGALRMESRSIEPGCGQVVEASPPAVLRAGPMTDNISCCAYRKCGKALVKKAGEHYAYWIDRKYCGDSCRISERKCRAADREADMAEIENAEIAAKQAALDAAAPNFSAHNINPRDGGPFRLSRPDTISLSGSSVMMAVRG